MCIPIFLFKRKTSENDWCKQHFLVVWLSAIYRCHYTNIVFFLDTSEPCPFLSTLIMYRHSTLIVYYRGNIVHQIWRPQRYGSFHYLEMINTTWSHPPNREIICQEYLICLLIQFCTKHRYDKGTTWLCNPFFPQRLLNRGVLSIHLRTWKTDWAFYGGKKNKKQKQKTCSHFSNLLGLIKYHSFAVSNIACNHLTQMWWQKVLYSIMFLIHWHSVQTFWPCKNSAIS